MDLSCQGHVENELDMTKNSLYRPLLSLKKIDIEGFHSRTQSCHFQYLQYGDEIAISSLAWIRIVTLAKV